MFLPSEEAIWSCSFVHSMENNGKSFILLQSWLYYIVILLRVCWVFSHQCAHCMTLLTVNHLTPAGRNGNLSQSFMSQYTSLSHPCLLFSWSIIANCKLVTFRQGLHFFLFKDGNLLFHANTVYKNKNLIKWKCKTIGFSFK